jgi:hypothetical protein
MAQPHLAVDTGAIETRISFVRVAGFLSFVAFSFLITEANSMAGAENIPSSRIPNRAENPPAAVDQAWLARIRNEIRNSQYEIIPPVTSEPGSASNGWRATNWTHGYQIAFTPDRVRLTSSSTAENNWQWGLSFERYGRGDRIMSVESPTLSTRGNRLNYDRGEIIEWYINDRRGLEQGFTLLSPPSLGVDSAECTGAISESRWPATHRKDCRPIFLDLIVSGSLSPSPSAVPGVVEFVTPDNRPVVRYSGLKVVDGSGRALPSRMELIHDSCRQIIRVQVDDRGAVYPVTVDPVATNPDWMARGFQPGALFGNSVATAGDVNGDGFSDVIVGAYRYDSDQVDEGKVFVYHGSATGLSLSPDWQVETNQSGSWFGYSVSTAGDVNGDGFSDVVVGAPRWDDGRTNEGRAFIYLGSTSGLSTTPDWEKSSNKADSWYAFSVSAAGDVNGDGFSDVVVGAPDWNTAQIFEGKAFVYHGSAAGLGNVANWKKEINQDYLHFGWAVASAGDVNGDGFDDVIVGAPACASPQPCSNLTGQAYVFHGSAAGLSTSESWIGQGIDAMGLFGDAVASAGDIDGDGFDDVIVGARFHSNGHGHEGQAFLYPGSASGLSSTWSWMGEGGQANAYFGTSVRGAGDVNGDGLDDIVVGAPGHNSAGRAYLYQGTTVGLSSSPDWIGTPPWGQALFGRSVSTAGDVNGDNFDDLIVGARSFSDGFSAEGAAFTYHGFSTSPGAGQIPDGVNIPGLPLTISLEENGAITLSWSPSCQAGDGDYEIYEGTLGDYANRVPVLCSTAGITAATFTPNSGDSYYLVVPRTPFREGSYGLSSEGTERLPGLTACLPQAGLVGCQ